MCIGHATQTGILLSSTMSFDDDDEWYDAVMDQGDLFDNVGDYHHRKGVVAAEHISAPTDRLQGYVDEGTVVDICVAHFASDRSQ